jgi:cobalt/nickel transport system ATP-binding protein
MGTTIVISTHDVDLAYAWADEIHVLRRGELIFSGNSEDFYSDPMAVHSTGVMQPSMFVINNNLAAFRGEDPAPYPRTESQLVSKMVSGPKGRMTAIPVGTDTDAAALGRILDGRGDSKVGVFGTVSRRMMYDSSLPADYVFNGFESCMGECLMGRDSILVCDRDSISLIESKIQRLKDFGTEVGFEVRA